MVIPKRVKVGGLTYKVTVTDQWDDESSCGITDNLKLTIRIRKAKEEAMRHSFMHELLHAINFEMKEKEVEFLAMSLTQLVNDNRNIFNK